MKNIPNLFTLLNLIFGSVAIIFILQNGVTIHYDAEGAQFIDIPEKIWLASLCMGIAAIVDFLDGFVARLFNAASPLGKQLDSLADVVTFGVAPSMIIYQFLRISFANEEDGIDTSTIVLLPALIIGAAAAFRLAKFNLDEKQQHYFRGVPTPAVGLLIASFPLIYWDPQFEQVSSFLVNKWFLYTLIIVLSWLMVSNIPLIAFKFKNKSLKANMPFVILAATAVIAAFLLHWLAVPLVFVLYILLSLIFKPSL